jgi:hypothetical protein
MSNENGKVLKTISFLRICEKSKKTASKRTYRNPIIYLTGKYLVDNGFNVGDFVEVTREVGRITITKLVNDV